MVINKYIQRDQRGPKESPKWISRKHNQLNGIRKSIQGMKMEFSTEIEILRIYKNLSEVPEVKNPANQTKAP